MKRKAEPIDTISEIEDQEYINTSSTDNQTRTIKSSTIAESILNQLPRLQLYGLVFFETSITEKQIELLFSYLNAQHNTIRKLCFYDNINNGSFDNENSYRIHDIFLKSLAQNQSITHLSFIDFCLEDRFATDFFVTFKNIHSLRYLEVRLETGGDYENIDFPSFVGAMKSLKNLKHLKLSNFDFVNITKDSMMNFREWLAQCCLKSLELYAIKIDNQSELASDFLVTISEGIKKNSSLVKIKIHHNCYNDTVDLGAYYKNIFDGINQQGNRITSCQIGDHDMFGDFVLYKALPDFVQNNKSLRKLICARDDSTYLNYDESDQSFDEDELNSSDENRQSFEPDEFNNKMLQALRKNTHLLSLTLFSVNDDDNETQEKFNQLLARNKRICFVETLLRAAFLCYSMKISNEKYIDTISLILEWTHAHPTNQQARGIVKSMYKIFDNRKKNQQDLPYIAPDILSKKQKKETQDSSLKN